MKTKLLLTIVLLGFLTTGFGQQNVAWDKWEWLKGEWVGEGGGQLGESSGTFSFSLDLDKKIMVRKSHTEFPATDKKPKAIHDDLMIVYSDNTGNPSKAIYFDNEGHTINYTVTYIDKSIILTSEKTQNASTFRLIYSLLEDKRVNTKFEMSQDGVKYTTYIEGKSKKAK